MFSLSGNLLTEIFQEYFGIIFYSKCPSKLIEWVRWPWKSLTKKSEFVEKKTVDEEWYGT